MRCACGNLQWGGAMKANTVIGDHIAVGTTSEKLMFLTKVVDVLCAMGYRATADDIMGYVSRCRYTLENEVDRVTVFSKKMV